MTTFSTGGSAVTFTTSGSAVSFAVTPASNAFATSPVVTPGAHASTHGAGGADPITTLGTVTTTLGTVTTLVANTATINAGTAAGLVHTGQSIFAAGSATGPSIAATGDTNTGIYFPAADQVGIATAGTARAVFTENGRLGMGLAAPAFNIHVQADSTSIAAFDSYSDASNPQVMFRRARNTSAAGSAVQSGDVLGIVSGRGHTGSGFTTSRATFQFAADENWTTTANGSRMEFYTTANGTTSPSIRLNISNNGQLTTGLGSAGTPVLSFTGDTNTGIYSPGADQVGIATAGTAAVIVNATQQVGIGTSPAYPLDVYNATSNTIAVRGDSTTQMLFRRASADATGPTLFIDKARGSIASPGTVSASDSLGWIQWRGWDGTQFLTAARIAATVDGTPGSNDMPGALSFLTTADGASSPTERMRIDNAGQITTGLGSAGTPVLSFSGDTNTGIYSPGADQVGIAVGGASGVHIATSGVVLGGTTVPTAGYSSTPQLSLVQTANDGFATWRGAADANGYNVAMHKTRNATPTSHTIVAASDQLGNVRFYGSDGAAWVQSVILRAAVDGTPGSGDVPGYFAVFTKPTGGAISEKMRIDNAGLITGTGTSLGAWTSYTPAIAGGTWALGDGTAAGYYCQIGKIVHYRAIITFGATSVYDATSTLQVDLPVTSRSTSNITNHTFTALARDVSAGAWYTLAMRPFVVSQTRSGLYVIGTNGLHANVTSTAPFTWASGDIIYYAGTYEAA